MPQTLASVLAIAFCSISLAKARSFSGVGQPRPMSRVPTVRAAESSAWQLRRFASPAQPDLLLPSAKSMSTSPSLPRPAFWHRWCPETAGPSVGREYLKLHRCIPLNNQLGHGLKSHAHVASLGLLGAFEFLSVALDSQCQGTTISCGQNSEIETSASALTRTLNANELTRLERRQGSCRW